MPPRLLCSNPYYLFCNISQFHEISKHVTEQIIVHCVTKSTTCYGYFVKECIRSSYALHLACKVSALESTSELARS